MNETSANLPESETVEARFAGQPSEQALPGSRRVFSPAAGREAGLQPPKVFEFQDHRKFLSSWLEWKKAGNPRFSGAVFSKRAGLQSPTLLGMVIRGTRNLGPESIRAFSRALELRGREALYFQNLVFFTQSRRSEDKAYYLEQLHASSPEGQKSVLTKIKDHARFFSRWYVVAIHQMVSLEDFEPSPEWMCRKLKRKITRKEAAEAWQILRDLGMVKLEGGRYRLVSPGIDFHPEGVDYALRNYHKDYLDRAREAIDGDPMEDREISTFTLAINDEDLGVIKQRIKDFRLSLNRDFPISKDSRSSVVAFNAQLLKLTE